MKSDTPTSFDPDDYRGRNRLLLLFAPSIKSPNYEVQMQQFMGEEAAFEERDLLLVEVLDEGESRVGSRQIDQEAAAALRARFGIAPDDFSIILVGKDGAEKRRDDAPVQAASIYKQIDALPMRRNETT